MRMLIRFVTVGLFCAAVAAGAVFWLASPEPGTGRRPPRSRPLGLSNREALPERRPRELGFDELPFEKGGVDVSLRYTGPIHDPHSLAELKEVVGGRGTRGIAALKADLDRLQPGPNPSPQQLRQAGLLRCDLAHLLMYEGRFEEADAELARALSDAKVAGAPPEIVVHLTALRGIMALRRGEVSNCVECVGASSCIFPLAPEAVHLQPSGSRAASAFFQEYLDAAPGDLRVRWLLNLAAMTLGEYPTMVPPDYRVAVDSFRSEADPGRFENVAIAAGLGARGPDQAGGSLFDDFTGDGRPDLFSTSMGTEQGASFFVNLGDGTFADRSDSAGLGDQVYCLNLCRTDFDNDGALDVLLLRGGWDIPMRLSLLRNAGDGTFTDVTVAAGLAEPIASMAAVWGDYDNDGFLDLFVCGEYLSPLGLTSSPDPRNKCRLYRNRGDGTFEDVAAAAGVLNERCAKGAAWGDYDDDGRLDLFVSNMGQPGRLYHNEGDGTFRDVAPELGITGPDLGFACWFWDYDNDGRIDLYINENKLLLAEEVALVLGRPIERTSRPCLYRNLGPDGFRDVAADVGLDRGLTPMGCNFADIDNDGFLDFYLGTGGMSYEHLVPNRLFLNLGGRRFADATTASGTGHLQKGHGISFADHDDDGDLDLFVQTGGPAPGDKAYNLLFRNPTHGRHWLKIKLVGTTTNRAAIGARIHAVVRGRDGAERSIHRTVGNNSSFGGNSLTETLGLLDATSVARLTISWPTSRTMQTFRDLPADRTLVITEGTESFETLPHPARPPAP
jgi:hypothetical protein